MSSPSKSGGHLPVMLHAAAAALLMAGAAPAMAAAVTLCAEPYAQNLPGAPATPMWGYRQVTAAGECSANAGVGTASPGPLITVAPGDTTLAITLVNKLQVPTSIVIAAQSLPSDGGPAVMAADVVGGTCVPSPAAAASSTDPNNPQNCRVRSFTGETAPEATRTYTFSNLRPGTYLYQSGTHPQVQVQMGLFGMVRQDATLAGSSGKLLFAAANAAYDLDVPVVLSEIDVAQHGLIAGTLGSANPASWKAGNNSTLNYAPNFFLVNGKVFDGGTATDLPVVAAPGSRLVLRLANAGLQSRSLMINSGTLKLLTEDGRPYPAALEHAAALLPAGKTSDALIIVNPPASGTDRSLALFDRRGGADGGSIARLAMSAPVLPFIQPIANQVANEGSVFTLQVLSGNLTGPLTLTTSPANMTISPTGLISWPAPTGTAVPTVLPVTVSDVSSGTSRSFDLRVNHTPTLPATGSYAVAHGSITAAVAGALTGAADADGDTPITATLTAAASAGSLTLNADGSFSWTGTQPASGTTAVTFGVAARDPYGLQSTPKTVTLNVAANVAPVAANDAYTMTLARAVVLGATVLRSVNDPLQITAMTNPVSLLTANDTDDGSIIVSTIARVVPVPPFTTGTISARRINPNSPAGCTTNCVTINPGAGQSQASVTMNANGTFTLVPHANLLTLPVLGTYEFRYTVRDDQNATSNQAVVRVTVQ